MRKQQPLKLSIILPFYNEKGNIPPLLKEYQSFKKTYDFELVCVNNGSTDGSAKIFSNYASKKTFNFIKIITIKKNNGYGHGIMTGVKKAKGDVIAWTHADKQTNPADVFLAFDIYKEHNDKNIIIKGKRIGRPFIDTFVSNCMAVIASVCLRMFLYEINAQPKLFHKSFVTHLREYPNDFLLDLYLLHTAKRLNYTVHSFSVHFHKRTYGKSKWAYSWRSRLWMIKRTLNYIQQLSN